MVLRPRCSYLIDRVVALGLPRQLPLGECTTERGLAFSCAADDETSAPMMGGALMCGGGCSCCCPGGITVVRTTLCPGTMAGTIMVARLVSNVGKLRFMTAGWSLGTNCSSLAGEGPPRPLSCCDGCLKAVLLLSGFLELLGLLVLEGSVIPLSGGGAVVLLLLCWSDCNCCLQVVSDLSSCIERSSPCILRSSATSRPILASARAPCACLSASLVSASLEWNSPSR